MKIYTICIDEERGRYMAFSSEDPRYREFSSTSEEEAAGKFVIMHGAENMEGVESIDIIEIPDKAPRKPRSDKGTKRKAGEQPTLSERIEDLDSREIDREHGSR